MYIIFVAEASKMTPLYVGNESPVCFTDSPVLLLRHGK